MFCVECGKEGKTYEGLCEACHLAKRRFVSLPEILDVQVCGDCFAARIGKRWVDALSLEKAIQLSMEESLKRERSVTDARLKVKLTERDSRNYLADVLVHFKAGEFTGEKEFNVNVRLRKDTCQRCGKRSGHYYEAIIQLRGPQRESRTDRLKAAREAIFSKVGKHASQSREVFISKEEKMHGGYDFYLSSSSVAKGVARDLVKAFGATSKSSSSLAGRKDGHDLVRMTYLVRLPDYEPGDILLIDGRYYSLRALEGNSLSLVDLETWQGSSATIGRLTTIETLSREQHVKRAEVLSDTGKELQVLDPETSMPVDIVKPAKLKEKMSSVCIVKTKCGILLVP